MPFCPKCGGLIDDDHSFCPKCGSGIKGGSSVNVVNKPEQRSNQTTIVQTKGGGFFSGLFEGLGGSMGCCCGCVLVVIIIFIILMLLLSAGQR